MAVPSPVEVLARQRGVPDEAILCPQSAKDELFLDQLRQIGPDLCVTAAYGNMLPTKFLSIPKYGVVNIHPSLLPKYRGAAPVPRAIEEGVTETGVSLAFTVLKCDAGPVLAQERVPLDPDVQAPELLEDLFTRGTQLLLRHLEDIWAGGAKAMAWEQDEAAASHAPKMTKEEGELDFSLPALTLHNKVRALAGWPGTFATFKLARPHDGSQAEVVVIKILKTRVPEEGVLQLVTEEERGSSGRVWFAGPPRAPRMLVLCGDGQVLEVVELQPPQKKGMAVKDFKNGLKGKVLDLCPPVL